MEPAGRPSTHRVNPFDPSLSVIDLSGAPPAYDEAPYNHPHPSCSRTNNFRDPRALSSSRTTSRPTDFYYAGSAATGPGSIGKGGRGAQKNQSNITTIVHTSQGGCRAAPDYEGESLSEKAPRGHSHATQTHMPSISTSDAHQTLRSPWIRAPDGSLARPQYPPPAASRDSDSSMCGCFNSLPPKVKLWLSFGAWIATSIGFILAVAFWKTEVFTGLDNLSGWLVHEGYTGYAYMFSLIVLTTIPPFPLYSTLMMLAGYTWGTWPGFVLSYASSLFGAIVVYFISRHFFGSSLVSLLRHMPSFARTVRAVSRNPKLLFLVRLAPYPYNVMNVLLAACPSLRWRTYIGCTAFSLLKVVIHTSIGSGIRSFKSYHGVGEDGIDGEKTASEQRSSDIAKWSTIIGVLLCVLLFVYLGHVARRAVDVELEDEEILECPSNGNLLPIHRQMDDIRPSYSPSRHQREPSTAEERMAFLSPVGNDSDEEDEMLDDIRLNGRTVYSRR